MKKITRVFFFLLILVCFAGCKKSYNHYSISDDFRTWMDYKRGSYWIYKSENSGKNDSTSVWQRTNGTSDAEKGSGYYFDYIDIRLKSQFAHAVYIRGNENYESTAVTTNEVIMPEALRSNLTINQKVIWNGGTYQELLRLDTLILNSRSFINVRHVRTGTTLAGDSIVREYFYARGIGMVKFRQQYKSTDSTWSLLRWSVSQD